jgi:hypothetical protein
MNKLGKFYKGLQQFWDYLSFRDMGNLGEGCLDDVKETKFRYLG